MAACRSGSRRIARSTVMITAATSATPIAHVSDANVSTTTSATPGTLASMTPRRPPIISARSKAYGADWVTPPVSPTWSHRTGSFARASPGDCCRLRVGGEVRALGRHPGHRAAALAQRFGEGDRVLERGGAGIVVEVHVDVGGVVRKDVAHGVDPSGELGVGVERPRVLLAFVEAQVAPVGRSPQRRDGSLAVGPAQRRLVPLQAPP